MVSLVIGRDESEALLMTPLIRDAIMSTSLWFEGCFDLMRVAVLSTTVSIALRPAAFIVSPDSKYESVFILP